MWRSPPPPRPVPTVPGTAFTLFYLLFLLQSPESPGIRKGERPSDGPAPPPFWLRACAGWSRG